MRKHLSSESELSVNGGSKQMLGGIRSVWASLYLLIIDDPGPDLRSLVPRCALVEGLARDAVVVHRVVQLQRPHQDVVRLEVAEDDVVLVQIRQACDDLKVSMWPSGTYWEPEERRTVTSVCFSHRQRAMTTRVSTT